MKAMPPTRAVMADIRETTAEQRDVPPGGEGLGIGQKLGPGEEIDVGKEIKDGWMCEREQEKLVAH
jgi:hypothetical protein